MGAAEPRPFADETLVEAARLLRALHDATAGSELAAEHEVVCHNDPSPCNYVFVDGRPVALIDFDHAAPGDRLRDLAYAGWLWAISADDGPAVPEQGRRLRLMADAYGTRESSLLLDAVLRRQAENYRDALARARSTDVAVAAYGRASADWQRHQMTWLHTHLQEFGAALGHVGRVSRTAAGSSAREG